MKLRENIFNIEMTSQDRITILFNHFDTLLYKIIRNIMNISPVYLCNFFIDSAAGVISGTSRNRNIFHGSADDTINTSKLKDLRYFKFVNRITQLSNRLAFNKYDGDTLFSIVKRIQFVRGILEQSILYFSKYSDSYLEDATKLSKLNNKLDSIDLEGWKERIEISSRMKTVEDILNVDRDVLYGLFHQINEFMNQVFKLKEKIILPYLRVCYSTANHFSTDSFKLDTNYQNSIYGLMYAFNCFNQHRNKSFGSYVKLWAKQSTLLGIKTNNFVRIPLNIWEMHSTIDKKLNTLMHKHNMLHIPADIIAKETNLKESQVKNVLDNIKMTQTYSLEHEIGINEDKKVTLLDTLTEKDEDGENQLDIKNLLDFLTKDEKKILCLHTGLIDELQKTPIEETSKKKEILRQMIYSKKIKFN